MRSNDDLATRLAVFLDAGLIHGVPTWAQIRQGELEMLPYVLSSSITNAGAYKKTLISHPLVRQPILLSQVGRDHMRTGLGLDVRLESLIKHLHFTYHMGMPNYDLQLIQTHPGGLDEMTRATRAILSGRGREAQRDARLADLLLQDASGYHERFLGEDGWIERARRFEYEPEGCGIPPEFSSIITFVNYCLEAFPPARPGLGRGRLRADVRLVMRMFREGGRLGWLSRDRM